MRDWQTLILFSRCAPWREKAVGFGSFGPYYKLTFSWATNPEKFFTFSRTLAIHMWIDILVWWSFEFSWDWEPTFIDLVCTFVFSWLFCKVSHHLSDCLFLVMFHMTSSPESSAINSSNCYLYRSKIMFGLNYLIFMFALFSNV